MNNTTKYFLYMNRVYKSVDEMFVVTEMPIPAQNPIIMCEDKAEIDGICSRFNFLFRKQVEELEKDKKATFFLTRAN